MLLSTLRAHDGEQYFTISRRGFLEAAQSLLPFFDTLPQDLSLPDDASPEEIEAACLPVLESALWAEYCRSASVEPSEIAERFRFDVGMDSNEAVAAAVKAYHSRHHWEACQRIAAAVIEHGKAQGYKGLSLENKVWVYINELTSGSYGFDFMFIALNLAEGIARGEKYPKPPISESEMDSE